MFVRLFVLRYSSGCIACMSKAFKGLPCLASIYFVILDQYYWSDKILYNLSEFKSLPIVNDSGASRRVAALRFNWNRAGRLWTVIFGIPIRGRPEEMIVVIEYIYCWVVCFRKGEIAFTEISRTRVRRIPAHRVSVRILTRSWLIDLIYDQSLRFTVFISDKFINAHLSVFLFGTLGAVLNSCVKCCDCCTTIPCNVCRLCLERQLEDPNQDQTSVDRLKC